jgi:hypothetical protein
MQINCCIDCCKMHPPIHQHNSINAPHLH